VSPPVNSTISGYIIMIKDELSGEDYQIAYDGRYNPGKFTAVLTQLELTKRYIVLGYALNEAGKGDDSNEEI
jgi:hypothetical protein